MPAAPQAKGDDELQSKLRRWVRQIREKGAELRAAVEEWQSKRSRDPNVPLVSGVEELWQAWVREAEAAYLDTRDPSRCS